MDLQQRNTSDDAGPTHARLDALLRSEPTPRAPLDLTRQILAAVAVRRASDLALAPLFAPGNPAGCSAAWARRQVAILVAAALALVLGLGATLGGSPAPRALTASARADLDAGLSIASDYLASLGALAQRLLDVGGAVLPGGPPLAILLVLGSALLVFNGLVCRGWRAIAVPRGPDPAGGSS